MRQADHSSILMKKELAERPFAPPPPCSNIPRELPLLEGAKIHECAPLFHPERTFTAAQRYRFVSQRVGNLHCCGILALRFAVYFRA